MTPFGFLLAALVVVKEESPPLLSVDRVKTPTFQVGRFQPCWRENKS
jgi:hypothetical protein